mmetsp:Transcript_16168/g.29426  ORF Transcript_16168/g.29426 Transcript_16168/m.29426 type:complete len:324 (-) Transcript_16168:498-1469(-)
MRNQLKFCRTHFRHAMKESGQFTPRLIHLHFLFGNLFLTFPFLVFKIIPINQITIFIVFFFLLLRIAVILDRFGIGIVFALFFGKQFGQPGGDHHLNISLVKTATRIKVHEGFGPFAKLHPIQPSGTTTGERTGKIVLSSLDKGFRKGIQETGLQGRTGPLNQMVCQVKTTNRIGIQERGSSGRIAPTLDDCPQCLESSGSFQGMFGSGKEGVHATGGGGNDAPHFFHDGYFFAAQVFLFGQLFHHPPSTNEVGRSIALAKFGFGQFQLLANPKCRPSIGAKLIFNVFRLTRRPPGQKRMCLQPNVIGIFCLSRILSRISDRQ